MWRAWAILGLVAVTGCPSLGAYQCQRDEDCNRQGVEGQCLADAACAYPETNGRCESGWARSPNAAESPGACLDPPAGSSSGSSSGSGSTTTESSNSDTTNPTTDGGGDTSTGDAPCVSAEVTLESGVFSPGAGLSDYVLWMPFDAWPKGAARLDAGDGLVITDAGGAPLPFEMRALLDGTPALWVKLPTFVADETLTLHFTFVPDTDGSDPIAVWETDYIGVWHFDDPPMGLDGDVARNALVSEEPGMLYGAMQPEQQVEGPTGPALMFDGMDDVVEVQASFLGQLDAYSISMWIRADDPDIANRGSFFQRLNGDFYYPRCWHGSDQNGRLICQHSVAESTNSTATGEDIPIGEFLHIALVRDADAGVTNMFVQGEVVGTMVDPVGATLDTDPEPLPLDLGAGEWGSLLGVIDEVRVGDHALSPERIRADFRSQRGQLEFVEYGPLEAASCPL